MARKKKSAVVGVALALVALALGATLPKDMRVVFAVIILIGIVLFVLSRVAQQKHSLTAQNGEAQVFAEALEKDPIGVIRGFDQMVRLQYIAAGSKPSMEAAGLLHGAIQMSLRVNAPEVALGTLPLLLDVFTHAPDLKGGHTEQLAQLALEFQEVKQHDSVVKILDVVVGVRRRFFGAEHAGTWTAQAHLAEALRSACQLDRARQEIDSAIHVWDTYAKATTETSMRASIETLLHSVAGVIAQDAKDDVSALKHLERAFFTDKEATSPMDRCVVALNYARSLMKVGRAAEAVEIMSREVPKLEAIPVENGAERQRLKEVANIVAGELGQLGFSQLGMRLGKIAVTETPRGPRETDIQAAVHGLLAQARSLKFAGRLNESAGKYKQSLTLLEETTDSNLRQLRAIVLDNALGLFCVRYGLAQKRGVIMDNGPIGDFEESSLIERTRAAFQESYEERDINTAMFFGNLGTLHSMGGRPREAEAAYDRAMQIFATHPPESRDIESLRDRFNTERANMRQMHSETIPGEEKNSIGVDALRKLDQDLIRTGGRFSSQRINQLTLWSSQLFQDNQGSAAFEFCREAVAAAKEYIRHVSEHSEFGGQAMVAYQPQVVNQAFRLEMNYYILTTTGRESLSAPNQIGFLNHLYTLAQLEMTSSVSAAFAIAGDAQRAARSALTDVHTIEATQIVLKDGEYFVLLMNTELLSAMIIGRTTAHMTHLHLHSMSLGFRESITNGNFLDVYDSNDPMMMSGLSQRIMPHLAPLLSNATHVIFATGTALSGFPLGILRWPDEHGSVSESGPCLLDRMALSVVPSVSSLIGCRIHRRPSEAERPFLGIANPKLGNVIPEVSADTLELLFARLGGGGDLRLLPTLPQTESMVRSIAESVGEASDAALLLGEQASREEIFALNASGELRRYRIICFATHGLMAQELRAYGIDQPALLLSSPGWAAALDSRDTAAIRSSLLTMEDAASLRLDSDIVMLTACNTAASNGEQLSDALSGLAESFIRAGARSVLVSYWAADAEATEVFVKHLFSASHGTLPRAEAIRRAMIATRDDASGRFAKPAYWSAFVLVGDGGAPLLTNRAPTG